MKYLLDTSVLLWAQEAPEKLNRKARELLSDDQAWLFLSAVNSWEISLKYALGKLTLFATPGEYVALCIRRWSLRTLDITVAHTFAVADLPFHHADPFDRMLVAQAGAEGMTLLTADRIFDKYEVKTLWCGTQNG